MLCFDMQCNAHHDNANAGVLCGYVIRDAEVYFQDLDDCCTGIC